jgi:hypothetical protein
MENALDVVLVPALAAAPALAAPTLAVSAPAMGELSEADLEVVVGGLTRAWVNLPEASLKPEGL